MDSTNEFIAYRLPGYKNYPRIIPAPANRFWMDDGTKGWANRCLPLRIANQAGWFVLNDADVEIVWGGKTALDSLKILTSDGQLPEYVESMFGFGIVTFTIPYLFRTPPGFNMLSRGPANLTKDGACPLEGIIETDWLPYTFTMNWQITRRIRPVKFRRGEPICMLTPIRRGDLEGFCPVVRDLESEPELHQSYKVWHESRKAIAAAMKGMTLAKDGPRPAIQGHYIRGEGHLGERAHGHQTKLMLKPFPGFADSDPSENGAPEPSRTGFWGRLFGKRG
ncbi:MAG: DUF6065 family protein [Bryobacteraceae bacterium]|jgi:hypothetical protein